MTEGFDNDMLWEEFHRVVNMSSEELRAYLLADASDEESFPPTPTWASTNWGGASSTFCASARAT